MTAGNWIAIFAILVPVGIGLLGLFFRIGSISESVDNIKPQISDLQKDIKGLIRITAQLDSDSSGLTSTYSPRKLTPRGEDIVAESGVGTIMDDNLQKLADEVKKMKPQNAYKAEVYLSTAVKNLVSEKNLNNFIEKAAYDSGQLVDTLFVLAVIYIRPKVFKIIEFDEEEIDKQSE